MKAILFGSIGVLAETSELQRRAYNAAFKSLGLPFHWNIATYCAQLRIVGGKNRLEALLHDRDETALIDEIHKLKQAEFAKLLTTTEIQPRAGILETLRACKQNGIKTGLITTTTQKQLESVFDVLSTHLQPSDFDIITTKSDVKAEKPAADIYHYALSQLGVSADTVVAVEDSEMNQAAAQSAGIPCYLLAGEYATIETGAYQIDNATQMLASAEIASKPVSDEAIMARGAA